MTHFIKYFIGIFLFLTSSLYAQYNQYDYTNGSFDISYNNKTEQLSVGYPHIGNDNFWLVISDGPMPQTDPAKFAILYGDVENQRLTVYPYNGIRGFDTDNASFTSHPQPIAQFNNIDLSDGFTIDASAINGASPANAAHDWKGVEFGEQVGVWYHTGEYSFEYDEHNQITRFRHPSGDPHNSTLDFHGHKTTVTPYHPPSTPHPVTAPSSIGALYCGMVATYFLLRRSRRQQK